ncbi:MAG: hypothetical protein IKD69_16545 [Solobacterium sp.]|nr:hypothetical protein [Solobacterium sp.]
MLKEILEDSTKEKVIQEKGSRRLLMELMAQDMVAAYDVSGWYDLHPILQEVMKRKSAETDDIGDDEQTKMNPDTVFRLSDDAKSEENKDYSPVTLKKMSYGE